jgi:hypothetical protein
VNSPSRADYFRNTPDLRALANVKLNSLFFFWWVPDGYLPGIMANYYFLKVMPEVKHPSLQEAFHLLLTLNYSI